MIKVLIISNKFSVIQTEWNVRRMIRNINQQLRTVAGTSWEASDILIRHGICKTVLEARFYFLHLRDKEAKVQRDSGACSRTLNKQETKQGFEPMSAWLNKPPSILPKYIASQSKRESLKDPPATCPIWELRTLQFLQKYSSK